MDSEGQTTSLISIRIGQNDEYHVFDMFFLADFSSIRLLNETHCSKNILIFFLSIFFA